jgi:enoyl-CoA hydratase/carnithine racemase
MPVAASPQLKELRVDRKGPIASVTFRAVTLARPFIAELSEVLRDLEADRSVRAVIFTGQRSVFMTGADRAELSRLQSHRDIDRFLSLPHDLVVRFLTSEKLLVAAINGYCLGGGLEFALACDLRTCASDLREKSGGQLAFLGLPETSLGIVPACGGAYLTFHSAGLSAARRLLFTSAPVSADDALRFGLVDLLLESGELLQETERWIAGILSQCPFSALVQTKKLVNAPVVDGLEKSLALAVAGLKHCCERGDKDERLSQAHVDNCRQFRTAGKIFS